jgi:nucleotide-binding universal stress UspA family protein
VPLETKTATFAYYLTGSTAMTPTLLILTDFFKGAHRALNLSVQLAQPLGARLVLLHVHRTSLFDPERLTGKLPDLNKEAIELAMASLTSNLPVPVVAEIGVGDMLDAVQESIKRHKPLLIVLSRPETEVTPDELVTTTALKLLRVYPYPLLIVPPDATSLGLPQRVMLAADSDPFTLGEHAQATRDVLNSLQANLTVLHVTESATRHTTQRALQTVVRTGLTHDLPRVTTTHICHTYPAEGIMQAIAEQRPDLLVMIARKHRFLEGLFHKSVTAELLLHSPVPVLVLPASREARAQNSQTSTQRSYAAR